MRLSFFKIFLKVVIKVIPQNKSYGTIFFLTFFKFTLPISVSKNTIKKISHPPCLLKRYKGPNLPHLCLYWHKSRASFHRFMVHFAVAVSKGF